MRNVSDNRKEKKMKINGYGKINSLAFQDKVHCLNCDKQVANPDIYYDKNGTYVSCPHCGGSFDVDVYVIERPINGISINGNEQAVDGNGKILGFCSERAAKVFVKNEGASLNDGILINLVE
ncbi:MAG: hypothetical protein IJT36_01690 [Alphaproteobacteria bacterium]|nr:hypothetical protein [Alphaproteobacteria bacterium]